MWLNFAVDITAGGRGLPAKRIAEASIAATELYGSCTKLGFDNCGTDQIERLDAALDALNDDVSLVVLPIRQVDLSFQALFVIAIVFLLLAYIAWCRAGTLRSIARAVDAAGSGDDPESVPHDLAIGSPPIWIWPLPRHGFDGVGGRRIAAVMGVSRGVRPVQAVLGAALVGALCLMAAHAVFVHYSIASRVVGAEFAELPAGTSWERAEPFKGELPHAMAFTGHAWLDLVVLVGGFAGAYLIIDRASGIAAATRASPAPADDRPGGRTRRAVLGAAGRALAVAGVLASVTVASNITQASLSGGYRLFGSVKRGRHKRPALIDLDLPAGLYVWMRQRQPDVIIAHFVRPDGRSKNIRVKVPQGVASRYALERATLESEERRVDRSGQSEAVEWKALQLCRDPGGGAAALDLIMSSLALEQYRYRNAANLRLFDLAAVIALRTGDRDRMGILVEIASQANTRWGDSLQQRIQSWTDGNSRWATKWTARPARKWDRQDVIYMS